MKPDGQSPQPDPPMPSDALCDADRLALDALSDALGRTDQLPDPLAPRARAAAALLALLGHGPSMGTADALADRVRRAVRHAPRLGATDTRSAPLPASGWVDDDPSLSPADAEALQALASNHYDPRRVPGPLRERAQHQANILALLGGAADVTTSPADPRAADRRDALVRRTLDLVQLEIDRQAARLVVEAPRPTRSRFRLADLVSVAAVVVLGGILLGPVLTGYRQQSIRTGCAANMGTAAMAFGQYASDFRESLPMASASLAGMPWWNVGRSPEQSNSANLFTLARTGYVNSLEPLACPGCDKAPRGKPQPGAWDWSSIDQVSVSFQNLFSRERPRWTQSARMVLLADRSPITLSSLRREPQNPFANSPNHGGTGQCVLHNDGSACWADSPVLTCCDAPDNIWLPRVIELGIEAADLSRRTGKPVILMGIEQPGTPTDIFLGP